MRSRGRGVESARAEAVRRRFELWRRTRRGRGRIPEKLWTSAAKLAGTYGLCRTARTLGLDYNALKRRVESAGVNGSPAGTIPGRKTRTRSRFNARKLRSESHIAKPPGSVPAMTFVELPSLDPTGVPECIVELEHPRGVKMRIRLTGRQSLEIVAALSQVFLSAKP